MATKPFKYQTPFPMGKDTTEYYLLSKDHVSVSNFNGKKYWSLNRKLLPA